MTEPGIDMLDEIESADTLAEANAAWDRLRASCPFVEGATDLETATAAYKKARRRAHPDAGGSDAEFIAVQEQYERWCDGYRSYRAVTRILQRHKPSAAVVADTATKPTLVERFAANLKRPKVRRKVAKAAGNAAQGIVDSLVSALLSK